MSDRYDVPDLGVAQAEVIELLVPAGTRVSKEQPVAVLESDKASLELPAPADGVIDEWLVSLGQQVKVGDPLLRLSSEATDAAPADEAAAEPVPEADGAATAPAAETAESAAAKTAPVADPVPEAIAPVAGEVHAGPAVRRLARELGVDLGQVPPSGPRQRILKEDVQAWVKQTLSQPRTAAAAPAEATLPPEPDYGRWGAIERVPRSRIQRRSAENLARAASIVPQVTQFDAADITSLEAFRLEQRDRFKAEGLSLTMTALVARAVAHLLREMPDFNSSLSRDGETLVRKDYVNLGIAVDTPNGLMVPVLHDADQLSLRALAARLGELAEQARTGKLPPAAMQGGTFSLSSLGGIGGTAFTPLVNWPEVAILGLSRAQHQPVWTGDAFVPRLMLPLSLSYDHRVIDGAAAARFTTRLAQLLADLRLLLV